MAKLIRISKQYFYDPIPNLHLPPPQYRQTIKELKQMDDLVVLLPDKGLGLVILEKKESRNKMDILLGDMERFKPGYTIETNFLIE